MRDLASPDGVPDSFAYQWLRVDNDGASNPVSIPALRTKMQPEGEHALSVVRRWRPISGGRQRLRDRRRCCAGQRLRVARVVDEGKPSP